MEGGGKEGKGRVSANPGSATVMCVQHGIPYLAQLDLGCIN